jgi:hypothetical protein
MLIMGKQEEERENRKSELEKKLKESKVEPEELGKLSSVAARKLGKREKEIQEIINSLDKDWASECGMSSPQYTRVQNAIGRYKEFIDNKALKDLRNIWILDTIFIAVVPVVIGIIAYFITSVSGLLTALSVGGVNAIEKVTRGQTILKTYSSDRRKLEGSVTTLQISLELCDPSDVACLQDVMNNLRACAKALIPPQPPPSTPTPTP